MSTGVLSEPHLMPQEALEAVSSVLPKQELLPETSILGLPSPKIEERERKTSQADTPAFFDQ